MPIAGQVVPIHDKDPADEIWKAAGSLDGIEPTFQNLIVATYIRPEDSKTSGGIIIPLQAVSEDRYQGKVGLVLKVGPRAFKDDGSVQFHGFSVKPGDWVAFRPSDGLKMQIGKCDCRLIADVHIKMTVATPDAVY